MAGTCVGAGLTIDGDGNVAIEGAVNGVWPYGCAVGTHNGLHTDPVTGNAWVKPAPVIGHAELLGTPRSIVPANDTDKSIIHVEVDYTVASCSHELVRYAAMGGYAAFRLESGNFWTVQRYLTLLVNGVSTYFTGLEPVATCENNSGGVLSQAGPVEATEGTYLAAPGDVLKFMADYTLQLPGFAAHALNNFYMRPPRISLVGVPTE